MTEAKLGGVHLSSQRPVEWQLQGGVFPTRVLFEVLEQRAKKVPLGVPLTLEIGGIKAQLVYALALHPTNTPHTVLIEVVDRRWLWGRTHIAADFNIRIRTGEVSLIGRRQEIAQPKPQIIYRPYSLREEAFPWKPREVLVEVLKQLVGEADQTVPIDLPKVEIEDLILDDAGPAALQRALSYIPGAQVKVELDGTVTVYLEHDQSERKELSGRLVEVGEDFPRLVELKALRPKNFNVYFTAEPELRFDFDAGTQDIGPAETVLRSSPPKQEKLLFENVLPVPDADLTIPAIAGKASRTVGRGSWVTIDEYLAALALKRRPPAAPVLTQELIREHFLSSFQRLALFYIIPADENRPDSLWQMRLNAIYQHWRQTFRVIQPWRDRFLSLVPFRSAVIDRETGMRAASEVHCNYIVRPSWRSFGVRKSKRHDHGWFIDDSYPIEAQENTSLADFRVAPFRVSTVDPELLIFHVAPVVDPWHEAESVAPGVPLSNQLPSLAPSAFNQHKEAFRAFWEWIILDPRWKLATVMTAIKATPNGLGRFHKEVVGAGELNQFFNPAPSGGEGPPMDIRVLPGLLTAKFMWIDDKYNPITRAFFRGDQLPRELLLNRQHVRNVALASAARMMEVYLNRVEGNFRTRVDPLLSPTGSLTNVTHRLNSNGEFSTFCSAQLPTQARDLWPFLPDSTRKALLQTLYAAG